MAKPLTITIPHPHRKVRAEFVHTGQGLDYFLIEVDGNLTQEYVGIPSGTRPLAEAVIQAYEEKFSQKS